MSKISIMKSFKYLIFPLIILFVAIATIVYFIKKDVSPYKNRELSLQTIFDEKPPSLLSTTTIVATGDINLANEINTLTLNEYRDFDWPFKYVTKVLASADLTIVNLESPLFTECKTPNINMYILCGSAGFIKAMNNNGIDVVNIANNHVIDYGIVKAEEEISNFKKIGLTVSGTDSSATKVVNNIKIAFLGFNDVPYNDIPFADDIKSQQIIKQATNLSEVSNTIRNTKKENDVVIVSFHWGTEYTTNVTARQRRLAHLAIDSGADLILGNHPHWIQPVEIYKNKIIVYSHGSLIFNQDNFTLAHTESENTKIGIIGKYYFLGKKIIDAEFIPIKIGVNNQPSVLVGMEKEKVIDFLKRESYGLSK